MRPRLQAQMAAWLLVMPVLACAHEYYTQTFQIIHPWTRTALAGAHSVGLYMRIIQIDEDDVLLSASTDVADRVELRRPTFAPAAMPAAPASAASAVSPTARPGIALLRGREVSMSPFTAHLVLRGLNTQLHEGREYALTLFFERAGEVPVAFVVGEH